MAGASSLLYECGPEALDDPEIDDVIDVRSPAEFAEDHVPGAISLPALDDAQRAEVGAIYKRDPFEARRLGAAMIARHTAEYLDGLLSNRPKRWRPLLYCWRGGLRSHSVATILASIGWRTAVLDGGYKTYRRWVRDEIRRVFAAPAPLRFVVIAGLTGSGKTALLQRLRALGAQTIDLEALANHRGSILGQIAASPEQPSQKRFESLLCKELRRFDPSRPVFVEAESNRIGGLHLPSEVWSAMVDAPVAELAADRPHRARALAEQYSHFTADPAALRATLAGLNARVGAARLAEWNRQIDAGDWDAFVSDILESHYDPAYRKSRKRHFQPPVMEVNVDPSSPESLRAAASEIAALGG